MPPPSCATSGWARSSPSATRWAGRSPCTCPAATRTSSPGSSCRRRRWSGAARVASGRSGGCSRSPARGCAAAGYRCYLNRAVPKLVGAGHRLEPYVPWLVSEMSRNDAFAMVDAGRALSRYDARPWAATLGVPAASLITTKDRLVRAAQAAGAGRGARRLAPRAGRPTTSPRCRTRPIRRPDRRAGRPRRRVSRRDDRRSRRRRRRLTVVEPRGQPVERTAAGRRAGRELLAGDDVGQHQPHAGDLPGQELGVGLGPLGDRAVELGLHPVAGLLAVLGQQDQRRGVRRLEREHQVSAG